MWRARTDRGRTARASAPPRTGQANDVHLAATCSLDCAEDVDTISARGNRKEHVAGAPVGLNLTGEGTLESVVVGHSGKRGSVGEQRYSAEWSPLLKESAGQLRGNVLRISR